MDKAYKDGYTPKVQGGTVALVLPLIANGDIAGNAITATPDLGDASTSPFMFTNYQKTVQLGSQQAEGGVAVSCYLVRFDLSLKTARVNGVYPVVVNIHAQGTDGTDIDQSFTEYVTITDGSDPTPATEKPSFQPKVIVSGYSLSHDPVTAGEEFTVTVTLKNTSKSKSVHNMTVTAACDTPLLILESASNTIFIDSLGAGKATSVKLKYKAELATPAQGYNISLTMSYENADASPLSSTGMVPVAVVQPLRVEAEAPQFPAQVTTGDTIPLQLQVMNMGRSAVYNVKCTLSAPRPCTVLLRVHRHDGGGNGGERGDRCVLSVQRIWTGNAINGKYGLTLGQLVDILRG